MPMTINSAAPEATKILPPPLDIYHREYSVPKLTFPEEIPRWDKIPRDIRILAHQAETGSVEALEGLIVCMGSEVLVALQTRVQDILHSRLMKKPPRECKTESDLNTVKLATVALGGVLRLFTDLGVAVGSEAFEDGFRRFWPATWTWVRYLYTRIYSAGLLHPHGTKLISGADKMTLQTIHQLMPRLLGCKSLEETRNPGETLGQPTDAFLILADTWIRLSEIQPDRALFTTAKIRASIIRCLMDYFQRDLEKWPLVLIKSMKEGNPKLASVCSNYVRIVVQGGEEDWVYDFSSLAEIITILIQRVDQLDHVLLSQHIMIDMTHAFTFFTKNLGRRARLASQIEHDVLTDLGAATALQYLIACCGVSDAFTWIIQSLRSGLIPSLLRYATFPKELRKLSQKLTGRRTSFSKDYPEDVVDRSVVEMIKRLEPYLVYRSVVRQVERPLKDPGLSVLESRLPSNSIMSLVWPAFKAVAEARMEGKKAFDLTEKYSQKCAAPDCDGVETKALFRHCAGCQATSYCSKACQTLDWKSGRHRDFCLKLREDRAAGIPSPISQLDLLFIFVTVVLELYHDYREIIKTRDKFLSQNPRNVEFVIVMDYCMYPTMTCFDLSDAFPPSLRPQLSNRIRNKDTTSGVSSSPSAALIVGIPHGNVVQYGIAHSGKAPTTLGWALEGIGKKTSNLKQAFPGRSYERWSRVDPQWLSKLPTQITFDISEPLELTISQMGLHLPD